MLTFYQRRSLMQPTQVNQKPNFITDSTGQAQLTMQDKASVFRPKIEDQRLAVSVPAPTRMPQHFRQRQQYYTGDA
jgi:hypothetical protein